MTPNHCQKYLQSCGANRSLRALLDVGRISERIGVGHNSFELVRRMGAERRAEIATCTYRDLRASNGSRRCRRRVVSRVGTLGTDPRPREPGWLRVWHCSEQSTAWLEQSASGRISPRLGADPRVEPGLPAAIGRLPEQQRIVVTLLYGYQWSMTEVAAFLGLAKTTIQNHAERGLARLRDELGVES